MGRKPGSLVRFVGRLALLGGASLALFTGLAGPAAAQPALGVRTAASPPGQQRLIGFDTQTPGTIDSDVTISGLQTGESIRAIDFYYPFGPEILYALGSTSRLYTINTTSGAATQVGSGPFTPALSGTSFGFSAGIECGAPVNGPCDPALETSDSGQYLRIDQLSGTATDSGPLAYEAGDPNFGQSPAIVGLGGSILEMPLGIDSGLDTLVLFDPGSATLTTVGALGVDTGPEVGFAVSPGGNPWAVLDVGGTSKLYRIDLGSGAATLFGNVGARITGGIALPVSPPQLNESPSPLAFGDQALGTASPTHTLTVTLVGGDALGDFTPFIRGTNPDDFTITRDLCLPGLASGSEVPLLQLPGDSCTVRFRFNPSALGPRSATFAFMEPKCCPGSPIFEIPLTGNGTSAPMGPAGPQGPQGPQGPPGRDATVTCKVKKSKKVKCTVAFASASGVRRARLSRHGVTYAEGKPKVEGGTLVLRFSSKRRLKPGRYILTVIQHLDGQRVVTKSAVWLS